MLMFIIIDEFKSNFIIFFNIKSTTCMFGRDLGKAYFELQTLITIKVQVQSNTLLVIYCFEYSLNISKCLSALFSVHPYLH